MSALLDVLEYTGDALAKPGRAIRGVLGGHLDEGLAAIPFSDSLGLTDRSREVKGTDLIGADPDSTWGNLAGAGVELALDPLNLVSGAGLARMSGLGAAAAASRLGRGLSQAASVSRDLGGIAGAAARNVGRGGVEDLLKARRQFAIVKPAEVAADGYRTVGRSSAEAGHDWGVEAIKNMTDGPFTSPAARGAYHPKAKAAIVNPIGEATPGVPHPHRLTARHEAVHGLADAAGGGTPTSPLLAALSRSRAADSPTVRGLGFLGEEMLARHAEQGAAGVRGFLQVPAANYVMSLRKSGAGTLGDMLYDRKLLRLYDGALAARAAAPKVALAGGVGVGGAGGLLAADHYLGGDE